MKACSAHVVKASHLKTTFFFLRFFFLPNISLNWKTQSRVLLRIPVKTAGHPIVWGPGEFITLHSCVSLGILGTRRRKNKMTPPFQTITFILYFSILCSKFLLNLIYNKLLNYISLFFKIKALLCQNLFFNYVLDLTLITPL